MAKKRKSDATRLDEVGRSTHATFCSAANSLSQLYSQAMNQQRLSFHAGERNALEKLYQWIVRQQEQGSRVSPIDIMAHLQNEIECGADETQMSPRPGIQPSQNAIQLANLGAPISSNPFGPANIGQGGRTGHLDQQSKNSVFSNALSSPVRRSLQQYHSTQGNYNSNNAMLSGLGSRNIEFASSPHQSRDTSSPMNDSSMDMHSDTSGHDSVY